MKRKLVLYRSVGRSRVVAVDRSFSQGKIAFDSCADGNCEMFLINPNGAVRSVDNFTSATDKGPSRKSNRDEIAFLIWR